MPEGRRRARSRAGIRGDEPAPGSSPAASVVRRQAVARAVAEDPDGVAPLLTPAGVLDLQSTVGNAAVQRLVAGASVQRAVADPQKWMPSADMALTEDIKGKHVVPAATREAARLKLGTRLPATRKSTIFEMTGEQALAEIEAHLKKAGTTAETLVADDAASTAYPMTNDYPIATAAVSKPVAKAEGIAKVWISEAKPKIGFSIRDYQPPQVPPYKRPPKRKALKLYHVTGSVPDAPDTTLADITLMTLFERDPAAANAQVKAADEAADAAALAIKQAEEAEQAAEEARAADQAAVDAEARRAANKKKNQAKKLKEKAKKAAAAAEAAKAESDGDDE